VNDPDDSGNQYSDSKKFLQYENNNYWIYKTYSYSWDGRESTSTVKSIFSGLETINDKIYYRLTNVNIKSKDDSSFLFYRLDNYSGYLYSYDKSSNSEYFITYLSSNPGEYEIDYENYPNSYTGVRISEETFERFGENVKILRHEVFDEETSRTYKYSDKYGYIDYSFQYGNVQKKRTLLGCYINSVVYGDTTFN
jgi:hypothetical protein